MKPRTPRFLEIANYLLRHTRGIIAITVGTVVLVGLLTIIKGADFVAESRFSPETPNVPSQLSGLAAQLGVPVPGSNAGESVEFYAELVRSPDLLRQVVETQYAFPIDPLRRDTIRGDLVELFEIKGRTRDQRIRNAVSTLRERITAEPEVKAGLVTVRTVAHWPRLAADINHRVLQLVADFNLKRRQTTARSERAFVQGRLKQSQQELESAERALKIFHERNRQWQGSPQLVYEQGRLQRQVDLANQVYLSLAQTYEQARIEEVRNTPVITVMDGPDNAIRRAGGSLLFNLVAAGFVGFVIACTYALLVEYLARERREEPDAYQELRQHLRRIRIRPGVNR